MREFVRVCGSVLFIGTFLLDSHCGRASEELVSLQDSAGEFQMTWCSVQTSRMVFNSVCSDMPEPTSSDEAITVSIFVRLDFLDRGNLTAIDVSSPLIKEILDEHGDPIEYEADSSGDVRHYREVRWVTAVEEGHIVRKLEPSSLVVQFRLMPNQALPSRISALSLSVCALYADDVIVVDVPFEVSSKTVQAEPDLEVFVLSNTPPAPGPIEYELDPNDPRGRILRPKSPIALYKYRTCVRSQTGKPVLGLEERWDFAGGFTLGDCVVMRTQLVDSLKQAVLMLSDQGVRSDPWGSAGAQCWGKAEQTADAYDTIRHIIAVRPREVQVPFDLTAIKVPSLKESERSGS